MTDHEFDLMTQAATRLAAEYWHNIAFMYRLQADAAGTDYDRHWLGQDALLCERYARDCEQTARNRAAGNDPFDELELEQRVEESRWDAIHDSIPTTGQDWDQPLPPPAGPVADAMPFAPAAPVALPAPCWWIDRHDGWETTHHATREDAVAEHVDAVRRDYGWVLSETGAFDIVPGVVRQEPRACYEATCPDCGAGNHLQDRTAPCFTECGHEFQVEQIALDDPDQTALFDLPPSPGEADPERWAATDAALAAADTALAGLDDEAAELQRAHYGDWWQADDPSAGRDWGAW